jgi:RNA polymerase subunit RPABC4/transcription elongation factor Spt4
VILLSDGLEEHWKSHVAEFFPQCPLCGSKSLDYDVEYGSAEDYIHCIDCNAKWEIGWKGDDFKIDYLTLLESGESEKYSNLEKEKHSLEFWREMMSTTKEGMPIFRGDTASKVKCEYCGTFFNEELDSCPNCGGRITDKRVLRGL